MTNQISVREVSVQYSQKKTRLVYVTEIQIAADLFRELLLTNVKECFVTLFLDIKMKVIGWNLVSIGSSNETLVQPVQIFQPAMLAGAEYIIISHNHPSGDCQPSLEDDILTAQLKQCGEILNMKILDHIILGDGVFYSYAQYGKI